MNSKQSDALASLVQELSQTAGQTIPEELVQQLSLLHDLAMRLPVTSSCDELFDFVAHYLLDHFGLINVGCFRTVDNQVEHQVTMGAYEEFLTETYEFIRPLGVSIPGKVAQTGKSLLVNDTRNNPDYEFFPDKERDPARAELCVPMLNQEEVIGCIGLQKDTVGGFSTMDIYAMEAVGAMMGAAVSRLSSFEILEKDARNRALMGAVRSRYMGNMAHELKTPIAVVRGYLEIMEMGKLGPVTDRQGKILETCLRHMDRLTDLLDQTLGFMSSGWEGQDFSVVQIIHCFEEMVGAMPEECTAKFKIDARSDGAVICQKSIVADSLGSFLLGHAVNPEVTELLIQVLDYKEKYFRIRIECNDGPPRETLRGILPHSKDDSDNWEERVATMRQVFFSLGGYLETEGPREKGWALNCYMPIWRNPSEESEPASPE